MKYLFIATFWISTLIHLYASKEKNTKLRNYSKPFILPSLLGMYVCSTENVLWSAVLAFIFSWLGDLFLIGKGVKWFSVGGVAFMISHFFFMISYSYDIPFDQVNIFLFLGIFLFYVTIVSFIFKELKKHLPKSLVIPMFFYLSINGLMNCFSLIRLISNVTTSNIITFIGATLFFISDSILFFVRFNKNSRFKTHFWVMFTYSIGEFLIALGLI